MELIYLKRPPKPHHLSKNLKVWKKKPAVTTYKNCRRFRPSCLHVNGKKQNLERRVIEVECSHVNILRDSFEAYFLSHHATELKSKLWILNPFGKQQPPGPLDQILKNDFCQQAFLNRGKYAKFCVGALDGASKDLAIQALKVLVQNPTTYLAEKGFSALVDIKTSKRSCVLNETLDDLMLGALERDIMPNWYEISRNIQQQKSH